MKFFEFIKNNENKIIDLYLDMDGVLAEYDIGNFDYQSIRPISSTISKVEKLSKQSNINIYILSICKTNKVVEEKIEWFEKHMKFLKPENMNLLSKENEEYEGIPSKEIKSNYLKNNAKSTNVTILVDDDNQILKHIRKNNPDINIFQDSSLVD